MTDHFSETAGLVDLDEFKTWILLENDDFLAINKPGWLVCHPSKNGPLSSLVGAAREYSGLEVMHLVSRLDRETSGAVVLAKNRRAAGIAQKAVETKDVGKKYLAILNGALEGEYVVTQPLAGDKNSQVAIKQACAPDRASAKSAATRFLPLRRGPRHTLCAVEILTGRKHQIRAHAQWIGREIVGDKIYGPDENVYLRFVENGLSEADLKLVQMKRQALHAWEMDFTKVVPGMLIRAPIPDDFAEFMRSNGLGDAESLEASHS